MPRPPIDPTTPVDFSGRLLKIQTSKAFEKSLREFILAMAKEEAFTMSRTEALRRLLGLGIAAWRNGLGVAPEGEKPEGGK